MNKFTFIGDSKTKEFFFKFPFFSKQDIVIKINSTPATDIKLFPTPSGMNADTPFTGGKIEFKKAPKSGDIITVYRKLELNRHVDYQPTGKLTPTNLNQDMNFMLEILKDMRYELTDFSSKYSEITNTDSTEQLITKINTVISEINKLGDISNIYPNLDTMKTGINELNTAITSATNNIRTLDNFKNGINDYVIEFQRPTPENSYRWYRKYNSGWIEQGGRYSLDYNNPGHDQGFSCDLIKHFSNIDYTICLNCIGGFSTTRIMDIEDLFTSSFRGFLQQSTTANLKFSWYACGF